MGAGTRHMGERLRAQVCHLRSACECGVEVVGESIPDTDGVPRSFCKQRPTIEFLALNRGTIAIAIKCIKAPSVVHRAQRVSVVSPKKPQTSAPTMGTWKKAVN
jgi:hypothetical protein